MGFWRKKDFQRLNRAVRCQLCPGTLPRGERQLWLDPQNNTLVAHPECVVRAEAAEREHQEEAAALLARGRELIRELLLGELDPVPAEAYFVGGLRPLIFHL